MVVFLVFLLGVGNFAAHKAVVESGHPLIGQMPWLFESLGGWLSLILEFTMLVGTLIAMGGGSNGWALFYALYTAANFGSAWAILTRRI